MSENRIEMAANSRRAEIYLYGKIGADWLFGGNTAESFRAALDQVPRGADLQLFINSRGGDIAEAVAMVAQLQRRRERHSISITADVEGLAASAASLMLMAADTIRMMRGSQLMIHEARITTPSGDVASHERSARRLQAVNADAAGIYAARSGMALADVETAMGDETWYNAEAAVKAGLADEIIEGFAATAQWAGKLDMEYSNVPSAFSAHGQTTPATRAPRGDTPVTFLKTLAALQLPATATDRDAADAVSLLLAHKLKLPEMDAALAAKDAEITTLRERATAAEAKADAVALDAFLDDLLAQGKIPAITSGRADLVRNNWSNRSLVDQIVATWTAPAVLDGRQSKPEQEVGNSGSDTGVTAVSAFRLLSTSLQQQLAGNNTITEDRARAVFNAAPHHLPEGVTLQAVK